MENEKLKMQNVRWPRFPFCVFHISFFFFSCSSILFLAGCFESAGTGGTGEIVVPQQRLHDAQPFDPSRFAAPASQPAAQPTSQPTTAPTTVDLTLERCRQLALEGNLGLKVE